MRISPLLIGFTVLAIITGTIVWTLSTIQNTSQPDLLKYRVLFSSNDATGSIPASDCQKQITESYIEITSNRSSTAEPILLKILNNHSDPEDTDCRARSALILGVYTASMNQNALAEQYFKESVDLSEKTDKRLLAPTKILAPLELAKFYSRTNQNQKLAHIAKIGRAHV